MWKFNFLRSHETKKDVFLKFLAVLIIFILYFIYVSFKFGIKNGFLVAWLTWAFFVLCTPIADAGLLIAFPLRLLFNIRMLKTQIALFFVAAILAIVSLFLNPAIFNTTLILSLFKIILTNPIYWSVIILSIIGTILSIMFGDEMFDVMYHHERTFFHKHFSKYELILYLTFFLITVIVYEHLIKSMGISIPLF